MGSSVLTTKSQAREVLSEVFIVRNETVIDAAHTIDPERLQSMADQAVMSVTGKESALQAWQSLFNKNDKVGLVPTPHLNPTHKEWVDTVRHSLIEIGLDKKQIIMAQGGPEKAKACDCLISMPALKAHWLTGIGTVLKNYIMYSGEPSQYHQQDSIKLGEIWNLPHVKDKTRLILVDALYPLCDKGPQPDPKYKWFYKGLIAGTDPVAVDTVGVAILTEKRAQLKGRPWPLSPPPLCVKAADKTYHLGTSDPENIRVQVLGWKKNALI